MVNEEKLFKYNLLKCKKANSSLHFFGNYNLLKCKKAQGEVVSTILLIMIVVAAAVIIIGFIIPLIEDIFKETKCSDFNGMVYATNDAKYTCYDNSTKRLILQIKFDGNLDKKDAELIKGLKIVVQIASNKSQIFDILPPNSLPSMSIVSYDGTPLDFPNKNEERTYNISNIDAKPDQVIIYPTLNNNLSCSGAANIINFVKSC